jgi:CRP-like cAMP-binding protein
MEMLKTIGQTESLCRVLADYPFLAGFPPRYLQFIADCTQVVTFSAGDYLLQQGTEANEFYLIQEGLVALGLNRARQGFSTVHTIGPGEVVGWSWLMPPHQWHMDAKAITAIQALALNGKVLRQKAELDHDFGYELFKRLGLIIGDRLRTTRQQMAR